jgi:hypothetical protein
MDVPVPQLDEKLLDEYALVFARLALDRLMAEAEIKCEAEDECAAE